MLHPLLSYSAKAEYPVRREFSVQSRAPRNTGSSAFADDDGVCGHNSAFSRHTAPEFCKFHSPQKTRGRSAIPRGTQGRPGARCTRGLMCQMHKAKNAHEHTGSAEAVRPSLRNGFTAYIVLSPARPGLFVTVARKKRELLANLTPAIGASGPHDFAVRLTRPSSKAHPRPPLPAPTSVTMANVPSSRDGMASNKQVIWVRSQGQFLKIRNDATA
jgi:hypothetical protein